MGTATERLMNLPDVEEIFQAFVRNANAVSKQARTRPSDRAPKPSVVPPPVVSLSSLPLRTPSSASTPQVGSTLVDDERALAALMEAEDIGELLGSVTMDEDENDEAEPVELVRRTGRPPAAETFPELEVDPAPGSNTQRIEAEKVVPDVASVAPPKPPSTLR